MMYPIIGFLLAVSHGVYAMDAQTPVQRLNIMSQSFSSKNKVECSQSSPGMRPVSPMAQVDQSALRAAITNQLLKAPFNSPESPKGHKKTQSAPTIPALALDDLQRATKLDSDRKPTPHAWGVNISNKPSPTTATTSKYSSMIDQKNHEEVVSLPGAVVEQPKISSYVSYTGRYTSVEWFQVQKCVHELYEALHQHTTLYSNVLNAEQDKRKYLTKILNKTVQDKHSFAIGLFNEVLPKIIDKILTEKGFPVTPTLTPTTSSQKYETQPTAKEAGCSCTIQ